MNNNNNNYYSKEILEIIINIYRMQLEILSNNRGN